MISEFDLIDKYFKRKPISATLGVGDDCALLTPKMGTQIAISSDMLVSGIHFFADTDPYQLGHKSLAVNLSDLAAMGAKPIGFTLALSLPEINEPWLKAFSEGMFALANQFHCELIGGDTTHGPLNICITIFGEIPIDHAIRRDRAMPNDDIWVSGTLGDARCALEHLLHNTTLDLNVFKALEPRLLKPTPRIELGISLRNIAHSALDISDGLIGDLQHILDASHLGATIYPDEVPKSDALLQCDFNLQRIATLTGGDDYELCFTAPQNKRDAVLKAAASCDVLVKRIGYTQKELGLRLLNLDGTPIEFNHTSFDHFA